MRACEWQCVRLSTSAEANAGKAFAAQLAAEEEADELRDRLAQLGAGAGSAEDDQASEADDPASQRQAYPFFDECLDFGDGGGVPSSLE